MAGLYKEKCDKCGKERPEFFVQVNKTNTVVTNIFAYALQF